MPALSSLTRQKLTDVVIDLGDGDVVTMKIDRNRVTPAWASRADDAEDGVATALAEVIVSWDITDDAGVGLPVTSETLTQLSIGSLRELLSRMLEASVPSRAEGNGSGSSSSTPVTGSDSSPVSHPNGHQPSPLPVPSASPSTT